MKPSCATGTLPRTDPYSFTRGGQPWFAWEWLADVAVGSIHRTLGLKGVALFYAAAIAAGVWLWFRLHWALGGNFLIACAMAPLLLSTCNIHWLARPHVLSWIFLLLAVFPRKPNLVVVGLVTALWANVHASFFFAPLIALLFALEDRWYLKAAAVAAVAPLLNPYGPQLYVHVFRYLTDTRTALAHRRVSILRFSQCRRRADHRHGHPRSDRRHAGPDAEAPASLCARHPDYRDGPALRPRPAALRAAPAAHRQCGDHEIGCGTLSGCEPIRRPGMSASAELDRQPVAGFLAYSDNLRALDARFCGLALTPLVLLAAFYLTPAAGFPADQFPVAAYPHIPAGARLFAPDKFGGYLIYRSNGTLKVFFDGRSDLYGADFLKQYSRLVQVRPGWRDVLGILPFHPRAAARRCAVAARPGTDRLAPDLRG